MNTLQRPLREDSRLATEGLGRSLDFVAAARPEPTLQTARTVGERIRAAYLAKGMNRSQLQRALGVAYTTLRAWERDESSPSFENLNALSALLEISVSELAGEERPRRPEPTTEAWLAFLETRAGQGMSDDERETLASVHLVGIAPTVPLYQSLLKGLRSGSGVRAKKK